MEHLFLPVGSEVDIFEYVGHTSDYIGVPFLEYPLRCGRDVYLAAQHDFTHFLFALRADSEIATRDDSSFLATWLFCGLLQEVLGIIPQRLGEQTLYDHDEYIRPNPNRNGVGDERRPVHCTTQLLPSLELWTALIKRHENASESHWKHLRQCLTITLSVLAAAKSKMQTSTRGVVATVAELLCIAVDSVFCDASYYRQELQCPMNWLSVGWIDTYSSGACANGWCPTEM